MRVFFKIASPAALVVSDVAAELVGRGGAGDAYAAEACNNQTQHQKDHITLLGEILQFFQKTAHEIASFPFYRSIIPPIAQKVNRGIVNVFRKTAAPHPFWMGCNGSQGFQQGFQLGDALDLVVCLDLALRMGRIDPDGLHAGIDTALDIGTQTVAHDHGLLGIETRNLSNAAVEIFLGGLVVADFLRNEDFLEEAALCFSRPGHLM